MLNTMKQEGNRTSMTSMTSNTFQVLKFFPFFKQRWCLSVTLTLPRTGPTAFCPSPDQSVTQTPSGTEKTQTSRLTTAITAASDTPRG